MKRMILPTLCLLAACGRGEQTASNAAAQPADATSNYVAAPPPVQAPVPAPPPANQLTDADKSTIVDGAIQALRGRMTVVAACAPYLSLEGGKVVDVSMNGGAGSAIVELQVAATSNFTPDVRASYFTECYGEPAGGLHPGVRFTSNWQVKIEHWQSGWRVNPAGNFTNVVR